MRVFLSEHADAGLTLTAQSHLRETDQAVLESVEPIANWGISAKPQPAVRREGGMEQQGEPIVVKPVPVSEGREEGAELTAPAKGALDNQRVRVYLTELKKVESVPLETYVTGVLAAEMPIDFELEALKAQAIAARTYIVRRLSSAVMANEKADVLDTVQHQAYLSKDELGKRWKGEEKTTNLAKLKRAIEETKGFILTYEGEPIEAAFFSTSNGFTENSEDYWAQSLPYLRSVASPWDEGISPRYEAETVWTKKEFYRALGLKGKAASAKPSITVTKRTEGNRIKEVLINGKSFSGREVREKLGLASSHFSWKISDHEIVILTYGLGHGVGMSQWGANGMAQEGKKATAILMHYYTGTRVEQASKLPSRTTS
ncbi:stage II sporulation protein D [Paenibacillus paeoniae]|uniref:Stage II sporulation protein D n=2 Tax=Paenibacillus paeoniae TaxID=2292705 RepID=A0A371P165_9BACL|nr:stage II sporulation protein D [Paenibacillus paeoniae]